MNFQEWYNSYKITGLDKRAAESIWDACRQECIKSIQQPIQNCDLSWEEVDRRFIEKLEKEV